MKEVNLITPPPPQFGQYEGISVEGWNGTFLSNNTTLNKDGSTSFAPGKSMVIPSANTPDITNKNADMSIRIVFELYYHNPGTSFQTLIGRFLQGIDHAGFILCVSNDSLYFLASSRYDLICPIGHNRVYDVEIRAIGTTVYLILDGAVVLEVPDHPIRLYNSDGGGIQNWRLNGYEPYTSSGHTAANLTFDLYSLDIVRL